VTAAPAAREGSVGWNNGSMRTEPVKYSADPLADGWDPLRMISMVVVLSLIAVPHQCSVFTEPRP
jgi:hypothetical protein